VLSGGKFDALPRTLPPTAKGKLSAMKTAAEGPAEACRFVLDHRQRSSAELLLREVTETCVHWGTSRV